jgi:hypothetical protein
MSGHSRRRGVERSVVDEGDLDEIGSRGDQSGVDCAVLGTQIWSCYVVELCP